MRILRGSFCVLLAGLAGCAAHNMRTMVGHMPQDLICGIDMSVIDERDKLLPNGWISKPYSPEHWNSFWNHRAFYLGRFNFNEYPQYSGPSGRILILYALQQRRELNLPDLVAEERNKEFVSDAYRELENRRQSSCQILGSPSPVCFLSAAQRPKPMRYQRECRSVS